MSTQYYWTCDICNTFAWAKCSHGGIAGHDSEDYRNFLINHCYQCPGAIRLKSEHQMPEIGDPQYNKPSNLYENKENPPEK